MSIFGGNKAKDLTAEIDRETDAVVLAEQETTGTAEVVAETAGMNDGKIGELAEKARSEAAKTEVHELEQAGWKAGEVSAETRMLGSAALEQAVIQSNEAVKEQVAIENGYVNTGLEAGRNVIGGQSEKQIKERSEADLRIAQLESGVDLPSELQGQAAIMSRNQESLAKGMVAALDRIMRRREAKPAEMEKVAWLVKMKILKALGREFGGRN